MQEEAQKYIESVVAPLCRGPVDIHCDASDVGFAFTLIPTIAEDYGTLIGYKGKNARTIHYLMKMWRTKNAPNMSIHVWTPNPSKMQKQS